MIFDLDQNKSSIHCKTGTDIRPKGSFATSAFPMRSRRDSITHSTKPEGTIFHKFHLKICMCNLLSYWISFY